QRVPQPVQVLDIEWVIEAELLPEAGERVASGHRPQHRLGRIAWSEMHHQEHDHRRRPEHQDQVHNPTDHPRQIHLAVQSPSPASRNAGSAGYDFQTSFRCKTFWSGLSMMPCTFLRAAVTKLEWNMKIHGASSAKIFCACL